MPLSLEIGLFDGCFTHQQSVGYGAENSNIKPKCVEFSRNRYQKINFYTDMHLKEIDNCKKDAINFAWLIEPPSLSNTHYRFIYQNYNKFDYVMSFYDSILADCIPNFLFYPLGGLWIPISQIGIKEKSKLVSLMVSEKNVAPGHIMRHAVRAFANDYGIAVYGRGVNPVQSKLQSLGDFAYSIVIESCQCDTYFSEKLVDCFSVGTIPIYWGSKNISKFFNMNGIFIFDNIQELLIILNKLKAGKMEGMGMEDYYSRMDAVRDNYERCQQYFCAEDWIYEHYLKEDDA